ncbi:MAG TPA: gephyrin-like molybdotransferase Glp [Rhizomicrobium sp.]|jgi:molybdopterin molybdotransferase|nr:gephyrin-like molybdotransferase Glp [Rhizomicrobium sp.]
MISVDEAVQRITSTVVPLESEIVPLEQGHRRVLARDVVARRDQPPAPVSAMDGYAVRLADTHGESVTLRIIGTSPAGHPFVATVGEGEAVRIFTGGVVPDGADAILLQEDAQADDDRVTLRAPATPRHIRKAGLDFHTGDVLLAAGRRVGARDLALIAAGDIAHVEVRRKPVIAFAATGDELARPGGPHRAGGIVASTGYGLAALIETWGGIPHDLGILPDTIEALQRIPGQTSDADVVVTIGGASVGDHDLVQRALAPKGFTLDFWKVAMRPGKPLIFGRLDNKLFLGLPGNPVSSYVCALLFLQPLIAALLGLPFKQPFESARLAGALPANNSRQDHLRARLSRRHDELWAEPFALQDSAMQNSLARADALIVRLPHAPTAQEGDRVSVIPLAE